MLQLDHEPVHWSALDYPPGGLALQQKRMQEEVLEAHSVVASLQARLVQMEAKAEAEAEADADEMGAQSESGGGSGGVGSADKGKGKGKAEGRAEGKAGLMTQSFLSAQGRGRSRRGLRL